MIIEELYSHKTMDKEVERKPRYNQRPVKETYWGISAPVIRSLAKKYQNDITDVKLDEMLKSRVHDVRGCALVIMDNKMKKATPEEQRKIARQYSKHLDKIDSWDLVDISAPYILGEYTYNIQDFTLLFSYAIADDVWRRRISIVATLTLVRHDQYDVSLKIAEILLEDKEDTIHKACGWVLREVGKHNRELLDDFLEKHYEKIDRTTLRYAIERHEEKIRKMILKGDFTWKQH